MKWLLAALILAALLGGAAGGRVAEAEGEPAAAASEKEVTLEVTASGPVSFTNVLFHYVSFDVQVRNAEKLVIRVLNPEGKQVNFRNRRRVDRKEPARSTAVYRLKKGQREWKGLDVLFQSGSKAGRWTVEITASAIGRAGAVKNLAVDIRDPDPLKMDMLGRVHAMLTGTEKREATGVEAGKIRYIAQDPDDPLFVKEYWTGKAYDLRKKANQSCTRAVFSMALSWLDIDCTPVRMSELAKGENIIHTYDPVCRLLKNVVRTEGDLETLWAEYEAGRASPVLLHFTYDDSMHAVLLAARDEENPELFYAVTSGQRVNTSLFPDGKNRDMVIPILIEKGETGQRIQSPLLSRYHKGQIDQIWQWKRTDTGEPDSVGNPEEPAGAEAKEQAEEEK